MGNCTVTLRRKNIHGGGRAEGQSVIADVNLSSSYATGGDTLTPAMLGLPAITFLDSGSSILSPGGHTVEVIYPAAESSAILLRARDVAAGTELGNGTNQSAQSIRVEAHFNPFV